MIVGNYIVTHHALARWGERGEPLPIEDALRAALPWGKRTARHFMLRSGSAVFHITLHGDRRVVTTVLTDAMADGNAQVFHGGRSGGRWLSASRNSARVRRHQAKLLHRNRRQHAEEE